MKIGNCISLLTLYTTSIVCLTGCSQSDPRTAKTLDSTPSEKTAEAPSNPKVEPAEVTKHEQVILEPLPAPEGVDGGYSIAQTMNFAHDNRLFRKLFTVPVAPEVGDRIKLLYAGLAKQQPPKGDVEAWKERASELIEAAERLIGGDEEAVTAFKKAVNCNSCHSSFRSS